MRVLIVANHNNDSFAPFIVEQVDTLKRIGVVADYFGIHGKGFYGYLTNLSPLKAKIREFHPDLIHAHYGLSGLLANLQRDVPVVTTYHGSDIHSKNMNLFLSRIAMRFSAFNIFVSGGLQQMANYHGSKQCVQPCGVDLTTFHPIERLEARKLLGWDADGKYVLFAGSFNSNVKNSPLAKEATAIVKDARLVELQGYCREEVNLAMNAANCLLMTSLREGSPQVVKEAMACGTPVVSVDVGDVKANTEGIAGCYITTYDVHDIAASLQQAIGFKGKTDGRQRITELGLSYEQVAEQIMDIYYHLMK